MPGGTGVELARVARELHPGVRVLYMSGYAGGEDIDAPLLSKPFPPDALLVAVRGALEGAQAGRGST